LKPVIYLNVIRCTRGPNNNHSDNFVTGKQAQSTEAVTTGITEKKQKKTNQKLYKMFSKDWGKGGGSRNIVAHITDYAQRV